MTKLLITSACIALLFSCNNLSPNSKKTTSAIKKADRSQKDKSIAASDEDDGNVEPSFDEVKAELLSRYNKVEHVDTTIIVEKDTLHIQEKYYCLKDNAVIVPKKYLWGGDTTKDFVTHNFVSCIVIIKNKDTIINKTFRKSDFDNVVNPEERKYAIIFTASFAGYKKLYDSIVFCYSITVPLTDVGVPACIAVNRKGEYKMLDEYAKLEN